MNNRSKINILMFNMSKYSDWQKGIANRNYHVLHNLIKREEVNKIIAVDFLPFTWRKAIKNYVYDQVLNDTRGTVIYGDLTSRCWQISSKILVYSTIDSLLKRSRIINELNRIISQEKMENNLLVWNYNPLYIDYFDQFSQNLNIFDAVDDWLTHSSYKKQHKELVKNYQTILAKSDLIFTVSPYLKQKMFGNEHHVTWLPNAVDLDYFQKETAVHPALKNLPTPIIGFLGILQDRIDINILELIARNNPEKSIVLAGPIWPEFPKEKFKKFPNVHFLGPIKHWEIPSLYNGFTVGIIPYKNNEFIKSTDPMKYYEYLAANLPIVSTPVPGVERFKNLILLAHNPEQFDNQLQIALSGNQKTLNAERLEILKDNTWRFRIEQMLDLIYTKLD